MKLILCHLDPTLPYFLPLFPLSPLSSISRRVSLVKFRFSPRLVIFLPGQPEKLPGHPMRGELPIGVIM